MSTTATVVPALVAGCLALLSEQQVAEIIHAKKQTLRAWRVRRKGPPYYKLNGRILYDRKDVEGWIEGCRVVPGEVKRLSKAAPTRSVRGSR